MCLVNLEKNKVVSIMTLEYVDIIQSFKHEITKVNESIWEAILYNMDEAIKGIKPSKRSQLSWTRMAALFGYRHEGTTENQFIWGTIIKTFGDADNAKIAKLLLGSLLQWRLALTEDQWLMSYVTREEIDVITGRYIRTAYYWIDNKFDVDKLKPANKRKPDSLSIAALANRFNSRK